MRARINAVMVTAEDFNQIENKKISYDELLRLLIEFLSIGIYTYRNTLRYIIHQSWKECNDKQRRER
jgi:hypothetical protein